MISPPLDLHPAKVPEMPIGTIFAWSLPLPGLILLVSESRHRRRRKRALQTSIDAELHFAG
jgi:hypothetical protein